MNLPGLVDDRWSEVVLSGKENTWLKGGDAGNIWRFFGAVEKLSKIVWHLGLKGVAVAESNWDEDDWEREGRTLIEGRFHLSKEDGGGNSINEDYDKHGDDNFHGDCGVLSAAPLPVSDVFTVAVNIFWFLKFKS